MTDRSQPDRLAAAARTQHGSAIPRRPAPPRPGAAAAALLATLLLSACASWDWRGTGRAMVSSHCRLEAGCTEICRDSPGSRSARSVCR